MKKLYIKLKQKSKTLHKKELNKFYLKLLNSEKIVDAKINHDQLELDIEETSEFAQDKTPIKNKHCFILASAFGSFNCDDRRVFNFITSVFGKKSAFYLFEITKSGISKEKSNNN